MTGSDVPSAVAATVGEVLLMAAADEPDSTALLCLNDGIRRSWTFAELAADASTAARGLLAGHKPGTVVALWTPNSPDAVIAQMAVALAGCTLVPLNPVLRPDEVAHVLTVSGAEIVLVAADHRGESLPDLVRGVIRPRSNADPHRSVDIVELDGTGDVLIGRGSASRATTATGPLPVVAPDDLAQIQFTSGTTGPSKGVRITHDAMTRTGRVFAERLTMGVGGGFLNPMPLFHTAGNVLGVMSCLVARAPHIVLPFAPEDTLAAIESEHPVVVSLAPTLLHLLKSHPGFPTTDLSSVEVVFTGGMTVSPRVVDEIEDAYGARLAITFGMTETCGSAIMTGPDDPDDDRRTTVGRAHSDTETRIVDPDGNEVAVGTPGELLLRGPRITDGYHGDPAATAATIDTDGWLRTGDEAVVDEHGRFRITGRIKDMIKTGGENVVPDEVEHCLTGHPSVDLAAVIGVPDERWGELVAAYVVPVAGQSIVIAELEAHCRERLASFKLPRRWEIVSELPQTASGKVQRAELRRRLVVPSDHSG